MRSLLADLRFAVRTLLKTPGTSLVAIVSLGIGIGSVTTVYTWTDRFILNPLPIVPDADRLAFVRATNRHGTDLSISYPTFQDWRERNQTFTGLAAMSLQQFGVRERDGEVPDRAWGALVSGNYFDILGTRARLGRTMRPEDEAGALPVVVLGHEYWTRRFRADPGVVGRAVVVNGQSFEVVGVMPPRFGGAYVGLNLDVYLPVTTYRALFGVDRLGERGSGFLEGIARLKPGVSLAAARDDMARVGRDLEQVFPDFGNLAIVEPIDAQGAPATMKPVFAALLVITGLVLLIACANVANLLLIRAQARQREIGVRLALGAARRRLVRQLMTESALLAVAAGVIGLLCAQLGRQGMLALIPPVPYPLASDFQVSGRVLLFALGVTVITVFIFGLWPAVRASRTDLIAVLRHLGVGGGVRGRVRSVLVGGQVALAVVALATAGLFLRAIERSRSLDPGFRAPDSLLLVDTDFTIAGLDAPGGRETMTRLLEGLRAIPGVRGAAVGTFVPLGWSCCSSADVEIEGRAADPDEERSQIYARVSDGYFETMGIPLVSGRSFSPADDRTATPVVIVNETFARRFWPASDPIGQRIRQFGTWSTVIGVAKDGRYRSLTDRPFPLVYRVWAQEFDPTVTVHLRVSSAPASVIASARAVFAKANVDLPFLDPRSMRQQMQQSTVGQEVGSRTLALFGAVALLLASIGLYGVMAFAVSQRTREIGVRVALGAASGDVTGMIVRQGLTIAAIGAGVGVGLALAAGQLLEGLLLGLSPLDPLTFGAVALLLGGIALVASFVPARRAAAIDPLVALKSD
jgi:predicted permease